MDSFKNDYGEGCHPRILEALSRANWEQEEGYGEDEYCREAGDLIRRRTGTPAAAVHFVSGGTQANLIVISAALRPHESVISAATGHIYVHEAGAVEATGHKINVLHKEDGKVAPRDVEAVLEEHGNVPHMVKPRMVYISNSTEIGTIYMKRELEELSAFCREKGLYLYLDGARLGSALCAEGNDAELKDIAACTDIFYIGGTKNGALLGEAIVINNEALKEDFGFHLKQHGALLAKGRVLGIQFAELFRDDLYFELARHANRMAGKITEACGDLGLAFLTASSTNQIFPVVPNRAIEVLSRSYGFYVWHKTDANHSAIRLVTSWATEEKVIDRLIMDLRRLI
jgi:threonine aldolase